jgi:hypothetical protein
MRKNDIVYIFLSLHVQSNAQNEKSVNPYFISFHTKIWSNEPTMRHKYLTMSPLFLGPIMNFNHLPKIYVAFNVKMELRIR